jgi:hypothetical protein
MKFIIVITLLVFVGMAAVSLWTKSRTSDNEIFPGSLTQEFLEQFITGETLRDPEYGNRSKLARSANSTGIEM